jgi:hypothetical protein
LHSIEASHKLFKPYKVKNNYDISHGPTVQLSIIIQINPFSEKGYSRELFFSGHSTPNYLIYFSSPPESQKGHPLLSKVKKREETKSPHGLQFELLSQISNTCMQVQSVRWGLTGPPRRTHKKRKINAFPAIMVVGWDSRVCRTFSSFHPSCVGGLCSKPNRTEY